MLQDLHTEDCVSKLKKLDKYTTAEKNICVLVDKLMKSRTEDLAVDFMALSALEIWKKLEREMSDKYSAWSDINDAQMKSIVKNVLYR